MHFARPAESEAALGLTPLIDVVLLLLIFFLVTTSFRPPSLPLELPGAESASARPERETIEIAVTRAGAIEVDGRAVPEDELVAALTRTPPAEGVVVRADRRTEHGRVVTILDAARRAHLPNIEIATSHPGDDPEK